jgi:hypothetical protein
LSGEIPLWLQEKSMLRLDLSHNKLTGDLDGFKHQESLNSSSLLYEWGNQSNLTLSVNRLSGDLPSSFGKYADLDILSGNLFGCDHIPKNDQNSESLSCGSEQYDRSMITMGGVLGMVMCLVGVNLVSFLLSSFLLESREDKGERQRVRLIRSVSYFQSEKSIGDIISPSAPHLHPPSLQSMVSFWSLVAHLMFSVCVLTALCLVFSLPVYVLKQLDAESTSEGETQYVTHTHMYNWLWTMTFVSGTTPAMVLMVAGFVCLLYFNVIMNRLGGKEERSPSLRISPVIGDRGHYIRITAVWTIFLVNLAVVGTANGLYIWSTLLDLASDVRLWIQLSFALFSSLWSAVLRRGLPSRIKESRYGVWLFSCLNVMNSVLIPCAVTALSTPSCYQVSFSTSWSLLTYYRDCSCLLMTFLPPIPINIVLCLLSYLMAALNVFNLP